MIHTSRQLKALVRNLSKGNSQDHVKVTLYD